MRPVSDPGSLREGRHQPDPSFVFLRSLSAGSEGWREGRQAEARLDRGRAGADGSPRKRQLPRAIHAGTKAAADPGVRRKSRSEVCNNHGGRRPSIPAGTDGIGTVRPWAPALGSPGRPRPPHLSGLPRSPQARPARPGSDSSQRPAPEPGSGASLTRIKAQKGRSDRGSERPENCPVDSFQRRTGGSPGQL